MQRGELQAPYIPNQEDHFDSYNCNAEWKDQEDEGLLKSNELLRRNSVQELFSEYYFDEHSKEANGPQFTHYSSRDMAKQQLNSTLIN